MAPATLALVAEGAPAGKRAGAIGGWAGASSAGLALGPLLGALLGERFGWSSVFLVNVPLAALALLVARRLLPPQPADRTIRFDLAGALAAAVALAAGIFAFTEGASYGWASPPVLAAAAASTAATTAFVLLERRSRWPLVDLALFRRPRFLGANLVTVLSTSVMCSVLFFLSLYLQSARGYGGLATGAVFLPMTALLALAAPAAGRLADRIGHAAPAASGMLLLALGLLALALLGIGGGLAALLPALALIGLGAALTTTPVTAAALAATPPEREGMGAAVVYLSRMLGLALGIAAMGALVAIGWPGGLTAATAAPAGFSAGLRLA